MCCAGEEHVLVKWTWVECVWGRVSSADSAWARGQGYLTQVFNQKTQSQDINYVLQNIKLDANQFNSSTAGSNYAEFDKEYKQRVDELLTGGLTETQLVSMIKNIVAGLHISHAPGCVMWTVDMKRAMPKLVALVFAVWTLHHSKRFLKAMVKPHPVVFYPHARYEMTCGDPGLDGQESLPLHAAPCPGLILILAVVLRVVRRL